MIDQPEPAEIEIVEAGTVLDRRCCRRVLLPDRRPGAVWQGLAFPLTDNRVDVSGDSFEPAECSAIDDPAPIPASRWALVAGEGESYLLLAGPAGGVPLAEARLQEAGLRVVRSGRYLGVSMETLQAEWFIRFAHGDSGAFLDERLHELFGDPADASPPTAPSSDLRLRLLQEDLLVARARAARLEAEAAQLRLGLASSAAEAEEQRRQVEMAQANQAALERELTAQKAEPPPPPMRVSHERKATGGPVRLRQEVAVVVDNLLPGLDLLRDSLDVMALEFAARRALWRLLGELQTSPRPPSGWKKLHGVEGWWESHVSNGQDDTGRLYARRTGARWQLLISQKREQNKDILWLRNYF